MTKELSPKQVLAVRCPTCGAAPGEKCELSTGLSRTNPHRDRRLEARDVGAWWPRRQASNEASNERLSCHQLRNCLEIARMRARRRSYSWVSFVDIGIKTAVCKAWNCWLCNVKSSSASSLSRFGEKLGVMIQFYGSD